MGHPIAPATGSRIAASQPRIKTAPMKSSTSSSTLARLTDATSPTSTIMTEYQTAALPTGTVMSCLDYGLDEDALLARQLAEQIATAPPERIKRGRKSKTEALTALNTNSVKDGRREDSSGGGSGSNKNTQAKMASGGSGNRISGSRSTSAISAANKAHMDNLPGPKRNALRKNAKLEMAPPLDFATVRTHAPHEEPPARLKPRLYNLQHCPVFYPTIAEFANPMGYMEKVGREAKEFGIAKVVPPEGWKPPFVLDTETFRFKTRLQRLNSMEASARASINFLEQLYVFHKQQGQAKIKIPIVNGRPVDLWRLRREVHLLGGYEGATSKRKWSSLAKSLGYDIKSAPSISFQLKTAFHKIIAPFDDYVVRVRGKEIAHHYPAATRTKAVNIGKGTKPLGVNPGAPETHTGPLPTEDRGISEQPNDIRGVTKNTSVTPLGIVLNVGKHGDDSPVTMERVHEATRKLNAVLGSAPGEELPNIPVANPALADVATGWEDPPDRGGEICEICGSDEDDPNILLCDCCDKGYHLQCLTPALDEVPEGNWYCDACIISTGNEFGFEEGKEHSLHSFQRRADGFKRAWLERYPVPERAAAKKKAKGWAYLDEAGRPLSESGAPMKEDSAWLRPEFQDELAMEDHIEREFWRLVESQSETVEIEYGADVHSSTYGSGLPSLESQPLEPYSRDGWNLNNMPIAPGSLLRYIKSDIAGMTRPWLYVGMVFSTFAWHKEDHYTYSVNYHHWGDTKTWYGVPGADDVKLEEAMKNAAPELFEQQPDLMYQLVTLMSPGRLKRAGVRTYVCDQRPNEFVITCPRSYHAGFNHGLNFNEAVNFCLPDWLGDGLICANHYKSLCKQPVFSHDEMLVTIFLHERGPRTSRWLYPHFREMIARELHDRKRTSESIQGLQYVVESHDLPEDQFQCHECKAFAYLSHIISPGCPRVACHDHVHVLGEGQKFLRQRYSDEQLTAMLRRVKLRADKAGRLTDAGETQQVEQRTSGRKRKPSAALLEAAGAELPRFAQKLKASHHGDSKSPSVDSSPAPAPLPPITENSGDIAETEASTRYTAAKHEALCTSVVEDLSEEAVGGAKIDSLSIADSDRPPAYNQLGNEDDTAMELDETLTSRYFEDPNNDSEREPEVEESFHLYDDAPQVVKIPSPSEQAALEPPASVALKRTISGHLKNAVGHGAISASAAAIRNPLMPDTRESVDERDNEIPNDELEGPPPATARTLAMNAPEPVPALSITEPRAPTPPQPVRRRPWPWDLGEPTPTPMNVPFSSVPLSSVPLSSVPHDTRPYTVNGKRIGRPPKSEAQRAADAATRAEAIRNGLIPAKANRGGKRASKSSAKGKSEPHSGEQMPALVHSGPSPQQHLPSNGAPLVSAASRKGAFAFNGHGISRDSGASRSSRESSEALSAFSLPPAPPSAMAGCSKSAFSYSTFKVGEGSQGSQPALQIKPLGSTQAPPPAAMPPEMPLEDELAYAKIVEKTRQIGAESHTPSRTPSFTPKTGTVRKPRSSTSQSQREATLAALRAPLPPIPDFSKMRDPVRFAQNQQRLPTATGISPPPPEPAQSQLHTAAPYYPTAFAGPSAGLSQPGLTIPALPQPTPEAPALITGPITAIAPLQRQSPAGQPVPPAAPIDEKPKPALSPAKSKEQWKLAEIPPWRPSSGSRGPQPSTSAVKDKIVWQGTPPGLPKRTSPC